MIKIAVVLEKCEEGGYSVHVPTVPGCFSEGETVEEALSNIADAIELHLEAIEDDLIVDEEAIVRELSWERGRPSPPRVSAGVPELEAQASPFATVPSSPASESPQAAFASKPFRKPRGIGPAENRREPPGAG